MGASTAYHLAQAGATDVLVLERTAHLEDSATSRCAGGVRFQFATKVNIELSKVSLPMLERFKDEIGVDPLYRMCGYFFVLTDPSDVEVFKGNVELQRSLGIETEWLDGDDVRRRLPLMQFEDALAGTLHHKDGLVDPSSVNMGYLDRARDLGVKIMMETEALGIDVDHGRVTGVRTDRGRLSCEHVVNAAGPWARLIGKFAGIDIPILPIRRQLVTTTPLPEIPPDFPFVLDFAQSLYFHREGEGLLTGQSNRQQEPGFDQRTDDAWEAKAEFVAEDEFSERDYRDLFNEIKTRYDIVEKEDIDRVVITDVEVEDLDTDDKDAIVTQELKVYYEDADGDDKKVYMTVKTTIVDEEVTRQRITFN